MLFGLQCLCRGGCKPLFYRWLNSNDKKMSLATSIKEESSDVSSVEGTIFLRELEIIRSELEKIYNSVDSDLLKKLKEIESDIDQFKVIGFKDLFEGSKYEDCLLVKIDEKVHELTEVKRYELPPSFIEKINFHVERVNCYWGKLRPFLLAYFALLDVDKLRNKNAGKQLKYCLRFIRMLSEVIDESIEVIPERFLLALGRLCSILSKNDFLEGNLSKQNRRDQQDLKLYCDSIQRKIANYDPELVDETDGDTFLLYKDVDTYNFLKKQERDLKQLDNQVLSKFRGKFVYFEDGVILDFDDSEDKLLQRVMEEVGYRSVYITKI